MEQLPDWKYINYALAVAQYGSVLKAANALYAAQPNISRAISELERKLGFQLFRRSRSGMTLTPQGELFLGKAEVLIAELDETIRQCREAEGREVCFAAVPSSLFVNAVLWADREQPALQLQCKEYQNCIDLFDAVVLGTCCAGFLTFGVGMKEPMLSYLRRRGLQYHFWGKSPAYGLVSKKSSIYREDGASPSIDYQNALVMLNTSYFEPIGITPKLEDYDLPTVRGTCTGMGRAGNLEMLMSIDDLVLLSYHTHSKLLERNDLAEVPLDPEAAVYEYGCITRENRARSAAEQQALLLLREAVCEELA